ncbi:MAG: hypothetical protein KF816_17215 [Melioribacteraceae bacterium]|nr:hypothetical protein [Melioribacteraceae bacterium]
MERPKMELEVNKPTRIKLLFNDCVEGSSKYGKYYLYAIQNGDGASEYSLFAADELHKQLKLFKKDDELMVTKLAVSRGSKIVVSWDVQKLEKPMEDNPPTPNEDVFYTAMEKSFDEALRLQNRFNGMANVNQIAITLFIQRTKGMHNLSGG